MSKNFVTAESILERGFLYAPAAELELLANPTRRALMARSAAMGFGLAGAALLGACHSGDGSSVAPIQTTPTPTPAPIGDVDILNFALNLEYLESEFYTYAVTGAAPVYATGTSGSGTAGTTTGGKMVTGLAADTLVRQYAKEIANDEKNHVNFLRAAITAAGGTPVARPSLNISTAFTALFQAAGIITSAQTFDPYASTTNFLLASFVFEDVGVTAYKGAAKLIANKTYLEAAAGILAAEAYHAGLVRTVLTARGYDTSNAFYDSTLVGTVQKLSDTRDAVDGTTTTATIPAGATTADDDQGITTATDTVTGLVMTNIVPTDANGIAYSRNADKVLNVVYLTGSAATSGGFFPGGVNGRINASTAASS